MTGWKVSRLLVAMCGVLVALIGHDLHSATAVVVGVAGVVPLLAKVLVLPKANRAGFVLSAVVAGMVLAGFATHQAGSPGQPRPVPAACVVAEVAR